jgi:hypothetical protein
MSFERVERIGKELVSRRISAEETHKLAKAYAEQKSGFQSAPQPSQSEKLFGKPTSTTVMHKVREYEDGTIVFIK